MEKNQRGREVASVDGKKMTYTDYKEQEEKKRTQNDNNDKKVCYVTGITYVNSVLNELSEEGTKSKEELKALLNKAFGFVPSSDQSDPLSSESMGDINDPSEG